MSSIELDKQAIRLREHSRTEDCLNKALVLPKKQPYADFPFAADFPFSTDFPSSAICSWVFEWLTVLRRPQLSILSRLFHTEIFECPINNKLVYSDTAVSEDRRVRATLVSRSSPPAPLSPSYFVTHERSFDVQEEKKMFVTLLVYLRPLVLWFYGSVVLWF